MAVPIPDATPLTSHDVVHHVPGRNRIGRHRSTRLSGVSGPPVAAGILAGAFAAVSVEDVRTWVGVSGTVTTLSALAMDLPDYDADAVHLSRLTVADLHRVTASLLAMPRDERAALGPMHPGRVDVIGAGAIVVEEVAHELAARAGITEMVVSEHDILDGIARSLT